MTGRLAFFLPLFNVSVSCISNITPLKRHKEMHIKGIKIAYAIIASFLRSLAALRPLGCGSGLYAFEGFTV